MTRPSESRRLVRPLALACALALLSPLAAASAFAFDGVTPPEGVAAGPCVEGICEYTLGNGLRVLLFPDATKPTVTVNIAYGVGSVHENYGETGMAHLLEHLLFKGTPKHPDIPAGMKARGIEKNATTSLDRTNYYGSFPANDATLDWLLGLEADRMVNAFVAKEDLDSEMTVVRNEMERSENSPGAVMFQRLRSTAYLWHNYGNSTIGARSDVENVPIERLQAFYRTWYRPDNATLIVAGRIDPAATLAKIQARFGPLARPKTALPAQYTVEPTQDGEREVVVRRSGDTKLVGIGYRTPGTTHPDTPALAVLFNVLGDVPSGRLHKALVETRLATATGGGNGSLREGGLANVVALVPMDGDLAKAEAELLRQVETRLAAEPVTEAEIALAKRRIANGYERNFSNVNAVAMALTESVAAGDWRLYFLLRDRIAAVTAEDVNRVARAYFKPSNRTIARFIPTDQADRADIATAPSAADALKGYVGKPALAAGESFDPTPANIQARTITFTIGDSLKVSLLPKDTRGDTVEVFTAFRYGDEASLARVPRMAAYATGSLLMRGTRTMTRAQIAERFEALKTTGSVSGGAQSAGISLTSRREHLADALALAADILRNPAFSDAEFELFRQESITGYEGILKEPGPVVRDAMDAHFNPWPAGHPLANRTIGQSIEDLRALERDDLVAFHRDFYGDAQGEIAIVGDFDPVAVRAQLESLFGQWRSTRPNATIHTHHVDVAAKRLRLETPDKANAEVRARMNLPLNIEDPDYPALLVANNIFGGGSLESRLGDRIRQKDGLSYNVSSSLYADGSPTGRDNAGSLTVQAIAAPGNVDRLEAALREELERFVRDGISAAELEAATSDILTRWQQGRAGDRTVATILLRNLRMNRTMDWTARLEANIRSLTVDDVNAAIRRHLRPQTLSVFAAGDFAKAGAKEHGLPAAAQ